MKNKLLFTFLLFSFTAHAQIITTVAGFDSVGYNGDNVLAIDAKLDAPLGVAIDGAGNFYIADTYNNRIRKVDIAGIITTIAGNDTTNYNGDNIPATNAHLLLPTGIIFDPFGNIYFADDYHNRIRKIDTAGIITTVAGNGIGGYNGDNIPADSAEVDDPHAVALDAHGNLYITDWNNHRVRKVSTLGIITTIAGTGTAGYTGDNGIATAAEINAPIGIVVDDTGNVYFADAHENIVRKIDTFGIITTFAGGGVGPSIGDNGPADSAILAGPGYMTIDNLGNIYVGDVGNSRIRKITSTSGIITTIIGDGLSGFSGDSGPATNAEINEPGSIALAPDGSLYFADFGNDRIRRVGWPEVVNQILHQVQDCIIYPNPATTTLTIQFINSVVQNGVEGQITVTNVLGQILYERTFANLSLVVIDISELPDGLYFIKVKGNEPKKFIKE